MYFNKPFINWAYLYVGKYLLRIEEDLLSEDEFRHVCDMFIMGGEL